MLIVSATPLAPQGISINFGQGAAGGGLNECIIQLIALMTALSLAPSILADRIGRHRALFLTSFRHGAGADPRV